MNTFRNLYILLENCRVSREIKTIIYTCIDSNYSISSMGLEVDVHYDNNHVQRAGKGFGQIFLAYQKATDIFLEIKDTEVQNNLGNGVVQISYNNDTRTLVIGTAGDVFSFKKDGEGFGFGNPGYVSSALLQDIIREIIDYISTDKKDIAFTAMEHHDCGLFANNMGKFHPEYSSGLKADGSNYMGSRYQRFEKAEKDAGAIDMTGYLLSQGVLKENIHVVSPAYKAREGGPSILKALKNSH